MTGDAWRPSLPLLVVSALAALFAVAYVALDFNALFSLRTGQNTGLYLQSLVEFVRHGTTFDQNDGKPHLAVHDQWLALVLAPAIALWPTAKTLIVAQVLLLAAAAPMLYAFARALGLARTPAAYIATAYLLAPSTQGWAYHPFVPEDALPLVAFAAATAIARRNLALALVACFLLLGIKEDEAFFLAWLGAFIALRFDRRIGIAIACLAVLDGAAYYAIDRAFGFWPEHPVYAFRDTSMPEQFAFVAEILAPLAFAPLLLGPRILLALPFAAELFLTQDRVYPLYQSGSYYTIPFVTLATIGAVIAISSRPSLARWSLACAAIMALLFNTTVLHFGRHPFAPDPQYAAAEAFSQSQAPIDFPCDDAGAWTVAAADPNARLACPDTATAHILDGDPAPPRSRPAWQDAPLGSTAAWTRGPNG